MVLNSLEVLLINSFCDQGKVTWPLWASTTIKVNSLAIPTRGWYDREDSKSKCMWTCSTKGCLNPSVCLILMLPTTWIPRNTLGTWYSGHRPLARECWGVELLFLFFLPSVAQLLLQPLVPRAPKERWRAIVSSEVTGYATGSGETSSYVKQANFFTHSFNKYVLSTLASWCFWERKPGKTILTIDLF